MTDGDATEWITIKIPAAVRDPAREDPRTYGDIMRDGLDADGTGGADVELGEGYEEIVERIAEGLDGVDADDLADAVAARMGPVELEASERRAIAQEVAEVLR